LKSEIYNFQTTTPGTDLNPFYDLEKLKELRDKKLITEEEFELVKKKTTAA
jgi:hypothetical protein